MSELMNESADIFNEDTKPKGNIVLRVVKWIGIGIIVLIVMLLFYRCATHSDHPIVEKVLMNEAFLTAHEQKGQLEVRKYGMQKPWVDVYEKSGRLIEFNNLYYVPETRQLQISLKYNEDIVPEGFDGFPFKLSLMDEDGNEYSEFWYETAKRERYRYLRICFENIDIEKEGTDKNGRKLRHSYYIRMDIVQPDGSYDYLCMEGKHLIYDGESDKNAVYDLVKYKVE